MIVSTGHDATAQRLIEGRVPDAPSQNALPRRYEQSRPVEQKAA